MFPLKATFPLLSTPIPKPKKPPDLSVHMDSNPIPMERSNSKDPGSSGKDVLIESAKEGTAMEEMKSFEIRSKMQKENVWGRSTPSTWAGLFKLKNNEEDWRSSPKILEKINQIQEKAKGKVLIAEKIKDKYQIVDLAAGFFAFKFSSEEDFWEVFSGGPWFLRGQGLSLIPWRDNFQPMQEKISIVPVWIQLPGLPLEFLNQNILPQLAAVIGRPVKIDEYTLSGERGRRKRRNFNPVNKNGDESKNAFMVLNNPTFESGLSKEESIQITQDAQNKGGIQVEAKGNAVDGIFHKSTSKVAEMEIDLESKKMKEIWKVKKKDEGKFKKGVDTSNVESGIVFTAKEREKNKGILMEENDSDEGLDVLSKKLSDSFSKIIEKVGGGVDYMEDDIDPEQSRIGVKTSQKARKMLKEVDTLINISIGYKQVKLKKRRFSKESIGISDEGDPGGLNNK
ncbi:hypothetical protein Cni_G12631 [Canna indica]|uniref:DUF4283 domain-containing protein n=1 Tax=Canna indica TaxID=4628 RepID=A0AAQ3KDV4_9LILI|nr:hypothetical protein Cni_G12631 [Canna indica]